MSDVGDVDDGSERSAAQPAEAVDVVIVGAGAAGLMTAIWAAQVGADRAEGQPAGGAPLSIVLLDGARTLGAKILVAGGGRCNVTHDVVDERAYAGSTAPAIRKVLRRFGVERTIAFFADRGVELKREETGKLFPVTDDARTVLNALLNAAREAGALIRHPRRVESIERVASGFIVRGAWGELAARRVVLATGGMALPKSGSDGAGYAFAARLGHSITPAVFPALVPLLLPESHPLRDLSGVTLQAEVRLVLSTGKIVARFTDSTLLTHFGLSGPSILDISRFWTAARASDPGAHLQLGSLPGASPEAFDAELVAAGSGTPSGVLRGRLPERLVRTLCAIAGIDPGANLRQTPKAIRQRFAHAVTALRVDPTGDRGFTHAEVTAGGIPLAEVRLETMESRCCPGLHLVGEICDVDGRIGGFNFQWAWASGYVAGSALSSELRS